MTGTCENFLLIASIASLLQEVSSSAKIKVKKEMLEVLWRGKKL